MTTLDSHVFDLTDQLALPAEDLHYLVDRTVAQFWEEVPRPDLLLSVAVALGVNRRLVVGAACACARVVLYAIPKGEDNPRLAVEAGERFARGEATAGEACLAGHNSQWSGSETNVSVVLSAVLNAYAAASCAALAANPEAKWAAANASSWAAAAYADSIVGAGRGRDHDRFDAERTRASDRACEEMADVVRKHITLDDLAAALGRETT